MRSYFLAIIIGALFLTVPAAAQNTVPSDLVQEKLIKTYLMTFNDANMTGNYTVLQAKLAKPFRDQFSPDKLKQAFKGFADQNVDLGIITTKQPVATTPSKIDKRGALVLRGQFDTAPSRVTYELDFVPSESEWKPIMIHVTVK